MSWTISRAYRIVSDRRNQRERRRSESEMEAYNAYKSELVGKEVDRLLIAMDLVEGYSWYQASSANLAP